VKSHSIEIAPPVTHPSQAENGPVLTEHRASILALTGIRFFAAFFVVLYHTQIPMFLAQHRLPVFGLFLAHGYIAVLLFFLLSGFILSYTYTGQIERIGGYRRFWEARFARIWPLYAFSLLLSSIINHSTPSAGLAVATIFMVQSWSPIRPEIASTWNFVCWTLSAEAFFYLVFPVFQRWLERRSTRWQTGFLCAMLLFSAAIGTGNHVVGTPITGAFRFIPLALLRLPEFLCGMALGNLYLRERGRLRERYHARRFGLLTWSSAGMSIALLCCRNLHLVALTCIPFASLLLGLAVEVDCPMFCTSEELV
jgi:peptidoglycan/LPS O-acetylase OafA/YrhL